MKFEDLTKLVGWDSVKALTRGHTENACDVQVASTSLVWHKALASSVELPFRLTPLSNLLGTYGFLVWHTYDQDCWDGDIP